MKMNNHFERHMLYVPLFSLALLAACSDENLITDPTSTEGSTIVQNSICFRPARASAGSDSWGDDADQIQTADDTGVCTVTRGAIVSSASTMHSSMGVFATLSDQGASDPKGVYIDNDRVSVYTDTADDGSTTQYWGFDEDRSYLWPGAGLSLSFFTYAPKSIDGLSASIDLDKSAYPMLHYSCPLTVSSQHDLLVASRPDVDGDYGNAVGLTFNHALAVVQILEGDIEAAGYIKSVALRKIHSSGDDSYESNTWTLNDSVNSYTITWDGYGKQVSQTSGTDVTTTDNTFIVLPQTLPDAAMLRVIFYDPSTKKQRTIEGSLKGIELKQGHTTRLRINIDQDLNATFDDESTPLDAHYVIADVKMNINTDKAWTLTASASDGADVSVQLTSDLNEYAAQGYWTDMSYSGSYGTSGVSARGTKTVSGTAAGDYEFSVFIPENTSTEKRTITLTLTGSDGSTVGTKTLTQLAPAWDADGRGWEQLQDTKLSSYGFAWDRCVYYVYSYSTGRTALTQSTRTKYQQYLEQIVSDNNASSFASVDKFTFSNFYYRFYIKIDYSLMNNLETFGLTSTDGLTNTRVLYEKGGEVLTNNFETIVMNTLKTETGKEDEAAFRMATTENNYKSYSDIMPSGSKPAGPSDDTDTEGSAAVGEVLKRNRYYLVKTKTTIDNVTSTSTSLKILDSDLVWYLPAKDEFANAPSSVEDPIDKSDSWSSTPDLSGSVDAYLGDGTVADRNDYHLVRAVRKTK